MEQKQVKRKLVAILSADVKNYTTLMQDDEPATVETLSRYKEIMESLILQHHGRVVGSPGDNLLAKFASVVDATQGAVAIQRELKPRNDTLAARLEGLSEPCGICISRTAFDQIEDKLPLGYEYMGEQQVKNIPKPVRAYKVLLFPEDKTRERRIPRPQPDPQTPPRHSRRAARKEHRKRRIKGRFRYHFKAYLGVIGFLAVINQHAHLRRHHLGSLACPGLGPGDLSPLAPCISCALKDAAQATPFIL